MHTATGLIRNSVLQVWGVDLVEEHLLCSCGIPSRPPVAARPLTQLAEYSVNAHKSGTVQSTDFLKVSETSMLLLRTDLQSLTAGSLSTCTTCRVHPAAPSVSLQPLSRPSTQC